MMEQESNSTVELQRVRIDLAYNGKPFNGFARQPDAHTVQGEIERVLFDILRRHPAIAAPADLQSVCAGRTDTGVHAAAQTIHVDVPADWVFLDKLDSLQQILIKRLQPAITIWRIQLVDGTFNARFSATARHYRYLLWDKAAMLPNWQIDTLHLSKPLDVVAMDEAVQPLVGTHNYTSFCRKRLITLQDGSTVEGTMMRTLTTAKVEYLDDGRIAVYLSGTAFCHQMVRSIVGCLLLVGLGKKPVEWVAQVLDQQDRSGAGSVAPAHGLSLIGVDFENGWDAARPVPTIFSPGLPDS